MRRRIALISIGCSIGWLAACSGGAPGDAGDGEGTTTASGLTITHLQVGTGASPGPTV